MTPSDDLPPKDLHPNDRAVLYDLLDGRLAPRAQDDVRRRLDDEPELRLAYEELVELRTRLAALPVPALPSDFLERVRSKAGFPAPTPAPVPASVEAAAAAVPVRATSDESPVVEAPKEPASDASAAVAPLGRVLSFARYAYGIAALLVVALGVSFWWLTANESAVAVRSESARREDVGRGGDAGTSRGRASMSGEFKAGERKANAKDADGSDATRSASNEVSATGAGGGGEGAPHFGPVGAVPHGLRTPSDDPSAERPPAAPVPLGRGKAPAAEGSLGGPSAGQAPEPSDSMRDGLAPAGQPAQPRSDVAPSPALAREGAKTSIDLVEGDEDVVTVYADSYDAARAEVAVWIADARAGRAPDVRRLVPPLGERAAASGGKAEWADKSSEADRRKHADAKDTPAPPGDAAPAPAGADAPSPAPVAPSDVILGSFVVELDASAFDRLSRSLPLGEGLLSLVDSATGRVPAGSAGYAAPPSPKPDAGSSPPRPPPVATPALPTAPATPDAMPSGATPAPAPPPAPVPAPAPVLPVEAGPTRQAAGADHPAMSDDAAKEKRVADGDQPSSPEEAGSPPSEPPAIHRVRIVVRPRR